MRLLMASINNLCWLFLHSIQISVFGYGTWNAVYLSFSTKALIYTENSVARGDVTICNLLQSALKCKTLFCLDVWMSSYKNMVVLGVFVYSHAWEIFWQLTSVLLTQWVNSVKFNPRVELRLRLTWGLSSDCCSSNIFHH